MQPIKQTERIMNRILLDSLPIWTTAQAQKTSNRGISASNQQLLGIQKLRELILELAVRGKLVPQDPNDEPASELLKKIEAEKKRLIKEEKIKMQAVLSDVEENNRLFQLPSTWEWVKIGNVGYTQTGGTPSKNDNSLFGSDIPFIKPGDIYPNYVDYSNEGLSFKGVDSLGRSAIEGSILMVCIGTIGKCNLIDRMCTFNQQINSISPYHKISDYILLALRSRYFQDTAWEKSSSTTIAILNKGKWENIGIPLPPLAEQYRVVERVNELMALCDELEKEQTNNNTAHETLVEVLLGTLTDAKNSDDVKEAWQRIAACFDTLFTTEHSIDKLKQTILQLAVMGKLVPQDPKDEPASELLKKIAKEKAQLIKEGKIKKQPPLPEITEEEKPFELPKGWEWVRLGEVLKKVTDGTHHSPPNFGNGDYMYISAKNIKNEGLLLDEITFVDKSIHDEIYSRCDPEYGDVLYIKDGATTGITTLNTLKVPFSMLSSVALLKVPIGLLNSFLLISLRSPYFYKEMRDEMTGVAITRVTLSKINKSIIALPPKEEQANIVTKVDELLTLCDRLKERIREAQEMQNTLAEEIVRRVVN